MAEELTLTPPVAGPTTTTYKVTVLNLSISGATVMIMVIDNNGKSFTFNYGGDVAIDYIKFINTGNFSVNSLQKRILQRLTQEGKLPPGNVTGTPDV